MPKYFVAVKRHVNCFKIEVMLLVAAVLCVLGGIAWLVIAR
jgi:hypothetical protein